MTISQARTSLLDWSRPHHWLAFAAGAGLSPWAPGTMGTVAAIPLYLLLSRIAWPWYLAVVLGLFVLGIWACDKTAREMGIDDPAPIVWDEVVGFLLTMTAAPTGWLWLVLGFVLFRLFDILKPWPIRVIDRRLKGGLGIMLDDILAGAMGWLVLQAVSRMMG